MSLVVVAVTVAAIEVRRAVAAAPVIGVGTWIVS